MGWRAGFCGVGDQLLVGVGVDGELLDLEGERAGDGMVVVLESCCGPRTRWLAHQVPKSGSRTLASVDHIVTFGCLDLLAPRPLQMIVDGATHTDLYDKDAYVTPAVARLTDFFRTHLTQTR